MRLTIALVNLPFKESSEITSSDTRQVIQRLRPYLQYVNSASSEVLILTRISIEIQQDSSTSYRYTTLQGLSQAAELLENTRLVSVTTARIIQNILALPSNGDDV